jgi:glycosyltransferase involved in cell wall biosynthesis
MLLDVSVIFPYHNENETIFTTLDLISRQTKMPKEVIFINSASTDETSKTIDNWIKSHQEGYLTKFINLFEGTNTPGSSNNIGIRNSKCSWIAFMDCGLLFDLNWLESQLLYVQENNVEVVFGYVYLVGIGSIDQAAVAQTFGHKRLRPVVPSTLVKKTLFNKTGLFLENRRAGFDIDWMAKLKYSNIKTGFNKNVVITYNGINYGNTLTFIFIKSYKYAIASVGLKYYKIPYYYLLLFLFTFTLLFSPPILIIIFLLYLICRGYLIPMIKSNGFSMFRTNPLLIFWLPVLAITIDSGRIIGTIKGFIKYHILKQ